MQDNEISLHVPVETDVDVDSCDHSNYNDPEDSQSICSMLSTHALPLTITVNYISM